MATRTRVPLLEYAYLPTRRVPWVLLLWYWLAGSRYGQSKGCNEVRLRRIMGRKATVLWLHCAGMVCMLYLRTAVKWVKFRGTGRSNGARRHDTKLASPKRRHG